jgi:hypothetical protein
MASSFRRSPWPARGVRSREWASMMQSTDRSTKVVDSYAGTPERPDHCLTGEAGDLKRTTRPSVRSETIAADDNARDAGRSPLRALERQPSRNASWPPGHGPDSPIDNGGPVFSDGRRPRQNAGSVRPAVVVLCRPGWGSVCRRFSRTRTAEAEKPRSRGGPARERRSRT